jgi:transmembrane sensor
MHEREQPGQGMTREFQHDSEDTLFAEANAWFFRLQADDVSETERTNFAVWLASSHAHSRAWDEVRELMGALKAPARAAQAASFPMPRAPAKPRRRSAALAGLFASALALVALVQAPAFLARLGADFVTVAGERRVVTLDDGTRIDMNSDTAITVDFKTGERRVEVRRGEAFFTVAAADRPFIIDAGDTEIRDIGTAFSVEYTARERVTVEEGLVDVGARGSAPVRVAARQQADFASGKVSAAMPADPETALAWRTGQVVFRQERLENVVTELNRYRAGRIVILNPNIAGLLVSGVFEIDRPDSVTAALETVLGIGAREITPWLVLLH